MASGMLLDDDCAHGKLSVKERPERFKNGAARRRRLRPTSEPI
jgi:hypothetical protein